MRSSIEAEGLFASEQLRDFMELQFAVALLAELYRVVVRKGAAAPRFSIRRRRWAGRASGEDQLHPDGDRKCV